MIPLRAAVVRRDEKWVECDTEVAFVIGDFSAAVALFEEYRERVEDNTHYLVIEVEGPSQLAHRVAER